LHSGNKNPNPGPAETKPEAAKAEPARPAEFEKGALMNIVAARSFVEAQGALYIPTVPIKANKLPFALIVELGAGQSKRAIAGDYIALEGDSVRIISAASFEAGFKRRFKHKKEGETDAA
jgi:hypothetical protein